MSDQFWKQWIPGALSRSQMKTLCDKDLIRGVSNNDAIGYSSFDLTLSDEGYLMKDGSVKPVFGEDYLDMLISHDLITKLEQDTRDSTFTLNPKSTYLFKVNESLSRFDIPIYGQATAKSTVGRVDVLARLIVDGADLYEGFNHNRFSSAGKMYLEITPMTFKVKVKKGIALSQLRLFFEDPSYSELKGRALNRFLISPSNTSAQEGSLSVDLSIVNISSTQRASAFSAKSGEDLPPIPLWEKDTLDPAIYWTLEKSNKNNRLVIKKSYFYILQSVERISLPSQIAVYCRASDETIGEMRIHYAGFVHPFFGINRSDNQNGTPLIFEVRGHDVNISLTHGEKLARLIFYRMSLPCESAGPQHYDDQALTLSKCFKPWN